MSRKLTFVSVFLASVSVCSTAIASEAIEDFEKAQGDLKLSFMTCTTKLRIYNLSAEENAYGSGNKKKTAKSLKEAAECMSRLQSSIRTVANQYKTTTNVAKSINTIENWQNRYLAITEVAIKHQSNDSMPARLLDAINESNAETASKMRSVEAEKSFWDRVREADKEITPINPDLEPVAPSQK